MDSYKYMAIVEWAKKAIEESGISAGDRFYSEAELCKMHGVSRQTVRGALSVLENENIIRRRQGSGTFVAYTGRPGTGFTVGVISTYFSDYIFPGIVTGIEQVLAKRGVAMQLATTRNLVAEEARALGAMLEQDVRALIVEPSKSALPNPNAALYDEIKARKIPLVFFNAKYPNMNFPLVALDDAAAAGAVTRHLIKLGHKRICAILVSDDIQGHKRYQGFMKALQGDGIAQPEQRVLWYSTKETATLFTHFERSIDELLKENTAVVCYNDALAVGLLEFCKRKGINVPGDLSVAGIDDSMQSAICVPPLTTVRHPQQQLGERAAEVLLQMIDAPARVPADVIFAPKLIERDSAGAPT